MSGHGRMNTNPSTYSFMEDRRKARAFYSSLHEVRVVDLHMERGKVSVVFPNGGDPREVPIPLIGFSMPPREIEKDKNFLKSSWGVYFPQVGDTLLVGFDAYGKAFSLGYYYLDYGMMKRYDDANDERGGIGWGDASGIRLRPGDWTFKSARNCALYLGDRAILRAGPHSIVVDKPNGEIKIQSDIIHEWYGNASESRSGSVRRILVPGVDTQENYVYSIPPTEVAQEHTHYIRRGAIPLPLAMVRTSEGHVVSDLTGQILPPATMLPDLATALRGTQARIFREVYDDVTGLVSMYTQVVDNLGNWGVSAKTALGFQWFTPAATWTVQNALVNWTTSGTYTLTCSAMTITSPSIMLGGSAAVEQLIKGTTFVSNLSTFLTAAATAWDTLAAVPLLAPAATQFTALATAAKVLNVSLSGTLSAVSKTL